MSIRYAAALLLIPISPILSASEVRAGWEDTLEQAAQGVVSIHVDQTRAFDTEWNSSSQATGFVVDAERGLILTNRHVVTPGPVVADATFLNHEEIELTPVYRDPVHDFGIYRYDPTALRFITPVALPLDPDGAQVGREIRVIGNDAGEQISILAGTLARLDREAPEYGRGSYNDFNTFYMQAASSTSGGSSGSPVLDIDGAVIGLNAGARSDAASSFFLPLSRVVRALEYIQAGMPVPRGSLQTTFVHRPFDELDRLGLDPEVQSEVRQRFPERTGLLIVDRVTPGGPAADLLEPGDILLRVEGAWVLDFIALETWLDESVGQVLTVEVDRAGEALSVEMNVDDLHAITPDRFVGFGGAVVHDLSYQQARSLNVPIRGVYVANGGYTLDTAAVPAGAVITALDGQPVANLDEFEQVLSSLADGELANVRYFSFDSPTVEELHVMRMDRSWFPSQHCVRDDTVGLWPCRDLAPGPEGAEVEPQSTTFVSNGDRRISTLAPSLVLVEFDIPYPVSGVGDSHYFGTGLVVDAERGLVLVDRNTVPIAIGDVSLTFASSLQVPAEVYWIHPLHNIALLRYDPVLLGDTPVRSAQLRVSELDPGERVWVVGVRPDRGIAAQATEIAGREALNLPLSSTFRFRDANLETISLVNPPADLDGVIADSRGRVLASWSSFAFQGGRQLAQSTRGIAAELLQRTLDEVLDGDGLVRSLEVEFAQIPVSAARRFGLPQTWAERLEAHDPERRQALQVVRVAAGAPARGAMIEGDLLVALDQQPVTRFSEVEIAAQREAVTVTVIRDGVVIELDLGTVALAGTDVDRILVWGGAILQAPHRALAMQRGIARSGVFVARYYFGTPASRYGLLAGRLIVEADGLPTPNLDAFLAAVTDENGRFKPEVRLTLRSWDGRSQPLAIRLDSHYWPTYELVRGPDGWTRREL
jgi:pro-apoptotic serine protease NMA111